MRLMEVLVESVLLYMGQLYWEVGTIWTSGEGAHASSQDFIGGIWDAFIH